MVNEFEIGRELPPWFLNPIFEGDVPKIESFQGKPLLILFFYIGCPGCKARAVPYANRIVHERGEDVNVVGIHSNFEGPDYSISELQELKEELFIRFPYFNDTGLAATFYEYKASGTPHWILIDKNGIVKDSIFGSNPNRALLRLDYHFKEILG